MGGPASVRVTAESTLTDTTSNEAIRYRLAGWFRRNLRVRGADDDGRDKHTERERPSLHCRPPSSHRRILTGHADISIRCADADPDVVDRVCRGAVGRQHASLRTSWTFDTYTPGPCSATGARHGGCNPGELVRIARDDDRERPGAALARDIRAGHERRPRHRAAGPSAHHPQRRARSGAGSGMAVSVDPLAQSPLDRAAPALRGQPDRVPDLREGEGRRGAHADDGRDRARPLRRQGAVGGRADLRGRRVGRRLVAGARGVRSRRHAVPRGRRPRQPEQQRRCQRSDQGAAARQPRRQGAAAHRGRRRAARTIPFVGKRRSEAGDLHLRPPQPAGVHVASGHARDVGAPRSARWAATS